MSKKIFILIFVVSVLALAVPVAATHPVLPDVLLAGYEDSEVGDLTIGKPEDPSLSISRVTGGGDVPPATEGSKILKLIWTETDGKFVVEHSWSSSTFNFEPYNLIKVDVWFDDVASQPETIALWDGSPEIWAPALSVPQGIREWHTVELDLRLVDYSNIDNLYAFIFESLAGESGLIYMDNMRLVQASFVQAWRPIPFDKAVSVDPNEDLSWTAGIDADSHDVYFGTTFNGVNDATTISTEFKGNQVLADADYDPSTLELLTTYYWRIDEINEGASELWKGNIWSMKTAPSSYIEIPLVSYEDSETHYTLTQDLVEPVSGDPDWTLFLGDKLAGSSTWDPTGPMPAVPVPAATDGSNVLGLRWDDGGSGETDLEFDHGYEFTGFTYDLYGIDEIAFDLYYPSTDPDGGPNPLPHNLVIFDSLFSPKANPSSNLPTTRDEWFTIVVDVSHLENIEMVRILDFMFQAHGKDFDPNAIDTDNHVGICFMDNLRLRYYPSPKATLPRPIHTATGVDRNTDLEWRAGMFAASHEVYFGTSFNGVNDATTASSEHKGSQVLANVNYTPPSLLDPDQTYYWRIDEVNGFDTWKGDVWNFTISEFSVVDDFELYTDTAAMKVVWSKVSGASATDIFLDTTIFYGDNSNSMKYIYDNKAGGPSDTYSEFEALASDLQAGTDWVVGNAKAMTLWFYGQAGNDPQEGLYVALEDGSNNVAVVEYDGNMNDITKEEWQQWNIRLQDFSDTGSVDLSNILKVYIGFGDRGSSAERPGAATGTVYLDDIYLWPPRCVAEISLGSGDFTGDCFVGIEDVELLSHDWLIGDYNVVAETPSTANLVAYYEFENNFNDSSINGNTGTPHGGISFVAGANGLAIDLDGFGDYLSISGSDTLGSVFDISDTITVAVWIKVANFDKEYQTIIAKGDDSWRLSRYQETNQLEFSVLDGAAPPFGNVIGRTSVNDGQWHHVAGVYDGSKVYLYIDGVIDNAEDLSGPIDNGIYNVYIGENEQKRAEGLAREWDGNIDQVRVYDTALSHAEIVSLAYESEVYQPVLSVANISDEEAQFSKTINLKDFVIMANRWFEELLFPF